MLCRFLLKITFVVAFVAVSVIPVMEASAFQVYSNFRAAASAKPQARQSGTVTFSRGNRHGLAGGLASRRWSYTTPQGQFRYNPVSSNRHSGTGYRSGSTSYFSNSSRLNRRSGIATFSGPAYYNPYVIGFNGVAVGGVVVNSGRGNYHAHGHHHRSGYPGTVYYVDPIAGSTFSPYAPGYPWVPGGQVPFGVYAPPIVVPYLNQGPGLDIGVNVVPGSIVPGGAVPSNIVPNVGIPNSGVLNEAPAPQNILQPVLGADPEQSITLPVDEIPIVDEFSVSGPPADASSSTTSSKIRSLRYQASADTYYRDADFASAEALYQTATKEAPDRQAPWIRLTFAQIARNNFEGAVRSLKVALKQNADPSSAWIDSKSLAGKQMKDRSSLNEDRLFAWLKQRPNSTDRLLLVAAWSEFRGSSSSANELLTMAKHQGLNESIVRSMKSVIKDQQPVDGQPANEKPAAAGPQPFSIPQKLIPLEPVKNTVPRPSESFSDSEIQQLSIPSGQAENSQPPRP